MNKPSLRTALAAVAMATLVAAGCGDDDDDTSSGSGSETVEETAAEADSGGYCEAVLAVETAPEPDVDFATASEDEIATAIQAWAGETMQPLVAEVVAVTPATIQDDVDVLVGAVDQMAENGDPTAFEQPDVDAASERVHQYDLDTCGWATQTVEATEYTFGDFPDELPAGVTSFELSNGGDEVHEVIVLRKNPGVTDSAEDLLALPQEEAMGKATMLGSPAFALPGDGDYKVIDLEPGEYIAVCFIPMGMTSADGPPPEGPPHFTQGMVAEFTVA